MLATGSGHCQVGRNRNAGARSTQMTAIDLQGAFNVRDLGGLRTRDGRRTRYGLIYRSDSLDSITPADARILFDKLGIGTIVDLRTKAETELSGLLFPVPRCRFSVLVEGRAAVRGTFGVIAENLPKGVATLFHCAAGRDRTGIIAALLLGVAAAT